jgi:ketosteroid isomerase-like protein
LKPGERTELARRMWLAWMRQDMDALCECVSDDVSWHPAGNFGQPWLGKEGIRAAAASQSLFPEGQQAEFHHFYEIGTTELPKRPIVDARLTDAPTKTTPAWFGKFRTTRSGGCAFTPT